MSPILELQNICKNYVQGGAIVPVLKDLSFKLMPAQMIALTGPSGSGKSTLLHVAGLLDEPTSGQVFIGGRDVTKAKDADRSALRAQSIGFIFQDHHLLPEFTALENVMMGGLLKGLSRKDAQVNAEGWLVEVGLAHRLTHRPDALSGGEQQRVAIARALVNYPSLILADEPTGNLDPDTAKHVFDLLVKMMEKSSVSLLIATHNFDLAGHMGGVYHLDQGALHEGVLPHKG